MRHSCLWSTVAVTAILLLNILRPEPVSSAASSQGIGKDFCNILLVELHFFCISAAMVHQ